MNDVQTRLEMLCRWLTNWLGKSVSTKDDWFCRSAAMAYQHFVDLAAKQYRQVDVHDKYSLNIQADFYSYPGGHVWLHTSIYLDNTDLRIDYSDTCYKLENEFCLSEVEMNWRSDETGNVRYEIPTGKGNDVCSFNDVLKMFDGSERRWSLAGLRIGRGERKVFTYQRCG